jgi:glycosyltransferase involved in cell wall biosynthesis
LADHAAASRIVFLSVPKVLIICAHRPGRSPSQRYRFEQYLSLLGKAGYTFEWSPLLGETADRIFYSRGRTPLKVLILFWNVIKRASDMLRFRRYDVVFIQREALFLGTAFFERRAAKSGAYVIFDFDDAIWLADTSPGNLRWEWVKCPSKLFDSIRAAHQVIAGNEFLAAKARPFNPHTVVIPTTVDTDTHVPKPALRGGAAVVIGWSGSVSTVKHVERLLPVLQKLKDKYGDRIHFRILGVAAVDFVLPDLICVPWTADTEVNELNRFDIGIMPLPDDEWSRGKCGLKALSYLACGIPAVVSPVGVNAEVITHGMNGFLAASDEEWLASLELLVADPSLRVKLGTAGRELVISKYSVAANAGKYLAVFEAHRTRAALTK